MRALRAGLTATLGVALAIYGCTGKRPGTEVHGTAATRLKPATTPLAEPTVQQTVYVPVYSSRYPGTDIKQNMVELSATVSVRNTSSRHPIVLNVVRYYDSAGQRVRDYIDGPWEPAARATVEFATQRSDTTGGPGANFLVQRTGAADIDEPVIEAVMIGQAANAGVFLYESRARRQEPAAMTNRGPTLPGLTVKPGALCLGTSRAVTVSVLEAMNDGDDSNTAS